MLLKYYCCVQKKIRLIKRENLTEIYKDSENGANNVKVKRNTLELIVKLYSNN